MAALWAVAPAAAQSRLAAGADTAGPDPSAVTLRFFGKCHLSPKHLTGGFGWRYVDTNFPAGLPESLCWAYPWYSTRCATSVPAKLGDNRGAGLRPDAGKGVVRLLGNSQWVDFGGSCSSPDLIEHRIEGWKRSNELLAYMRTLEKHPIPRAVNMTQFGR